MTRIDLFDAVVQYLDVDGKKDSENFYFRSICKSFTSFMTVNIQTAKSHMNDAFLQNR